MKDNIDKGKELLLSIAEGDEQAFSTFFYQYLPSLHNFVIRFTKTAYATEEVIQRVFIRVWLNREKLREIENAQAWLHKYATNEALYYLRAEKQKNKHVIGLREITGLQEQQDHLTASSINVNEINQPIVHAISKLPEQRKRIYLLSRNEGLTIPEIALQLQISPNTVKNTLVVTLKTIRKYLALHGYTFSLFAVLFSER